MSNNGVELNRLEGFEPQILSRIIWVSDQARNYWSPILEQMKSFAGFLEIQSVVDDHRACAWATVSEETYLTHVSKWTKLGLSSLPLRRVASMGGFSHRFIDPIPGKPNMLCVVIGKKLSDLIQFEDAFKKSDNITQGRLLGFPDCCCEFFDRNWKQGIIDPVWEAANNTDKIRRLDNYVEIFGGFSLSNSLLRYAGVRASFHIPHSFDCQKTAEVSKKRLVLGEAYNYDLVENIKNLLSMSIRWDLYHGISIISTPIFYVEVGSVGTKDRYVVDYKGNFIPKYAVQGLTFPFNLS